MEFEFKIEEDDFLTFQLYNASKSKAIRKTRKRRRSTVSILYITVSFIFLLLQNYPMAFGFFLISVLWFVLYPMYERRKYVRQFKKYVAEHFKESFTKKSKVKVEDGVWYSKNEDKEAQFLIKDISEINEILDYFFIKLKSGYILIIPKREINELVNLTTTLKDSALKHSFIYNKDLEWEWR